MDVLWAGIVDTQSLLFEPLQEKTYLGLLYLLCGSDGLKSLRVLFFRDAF